VEFKAEGKDSFDLVESAFKSKRSWKRKLGKGINKHWKYLAIFYTT
jgi:hypothetical protein